MRNISKTVALFLLVGFGLLGLVFAKAPYLFDFQNIEQARNFYRTAREYQKNGEYRNAFYAYAKISAGYPAYDAALFHQAKCAAELQDEKTAVLKFKKLLSNYPDSPIAPQASYNLGQAYIRLKDFPEAEKQFFETTKKYPETDFAIGSYYYLGQAIKDKDSKTASEYWLKYIESAPSGRFAMNCCEELKNLPYKYSSKQLKDIAVALYNAEYYSKSLSYLKKVPLKQSWFYIAKNHEALGDKNKAVYFYKEGLKKSSSAYEKRENFEYAMKYCASVNPKGLDKGWDEVLSYTGTARDYALSNKALSASKSQSFKYYWEIVNKYSKGSFASEALWNIFWDAYVNKKDDYNFALKLGKNHISQYENTKAAPAIYFWMGKIYENKGEKSKATGFYQEVLSKYPDSYYAFRSNGRIKAIKTGVDPGWKTNLHSKIPENQDEIKLPYSDKEITHLYGKQTLELINIGDYETVSSFVKDDAFLNSWINFQNGIVSRSIVIARNKMDKLSEKPDADDSRWKLIYPIYYYEDINGNAKLNNIDPVIILSLMKEESYFNTFALSSSNARGLMQILPGTAKDISRWKNLGSYSNIQLFDPDVNIKLGTAYLSHVKSSLHNNMLFAVAAYNGGPGAVEKWLNANQGKDLDEFIENIPYEQTNTYVKKVYKSYWNYKRIYKI